MTITKNLKRKGKKKGKLPETIIVLKQRKTRKLKEEENGKRTEGRTKGVVRVNLRRAQSKMYMRSVLLESCKECGVILQTLKQKSSD